MPPTTKDSERLRRWLSNQPGAGSPPSIDCGSSRRRTDVRARAKSDVCFAARVCTARICRLGAKPESEVAGTRRIVSEVFYLLITRELLVLLVSRRHTPSRAGFVPEGVTRHEESSPNALRHLRQKPQHPRPLRPRPEPARQAPLTRRLLQVLVAVRAPRRQARQPRPRTLPGGHPGDGPQPSA